MSSFLPLSKLYQPFSQMSIAKKSNIIRAIVMGANDGIASIAAIVLGVAGATNDPFTIFIAGFAGTLAGMVSMASSEYVSVHSQNDAQIKAEITQKLALENDYATEFQFVYDKYVAEGLSKKLAKKATQEMMTQNALLTTVRERHGFTLSQETSALAAAISSMISFPIGALLPILAITLLPTTIHIYATFVSVLVALALTGYVAGRMGDADVLKSMIRNIISGMFTMGIAYAVGVFISHLH